MLYDISLTNADTDENLGDGFRFDILIGEPQGELGEHLAALYINGDGCGFILLRADLSDIGTLDDFC